MDVTKCHACHAKYRGATGDQARPTARTSAPPKPARCRKCHACHAKRRSMPPSATPATQREGPCRQVPRMPRETKVDVPKCHAKPRWMSPSATPATQSTAASVTGDQARPIAPPKPAQCRKRHACHAKRRSMSPSATSATRREGRCTPATQNRGGCHQVPHLPREGVDVAKCRACHAKYRRVTTAPKRAPECATKASPVLQVPRLPRKTKVNVTQSPSATPATQNKVDDTKCNACHAKRRSMPPRAPPATRSEGGCHQVPRLPRKVPRRHRRPSAPKGAPKRATKASPVQQAPPATRNQGGCHQATPATQKTAASPASKRPRAHQSAPPKPAQCRKRHACHAKKVDVTCSATPATRSEGRCRQVPCLPREGKVDVAKCPRKCHACHPKRRWVSPSAKVV